MRLRLTCRDTSRRTGAWTRCRPSAAASAARRTCPCRRWPCTCWRTVWATCAACAASSSLGRGCYVVTCARTPARNRTTANRAGRRSPTAPTYEHTCRHTRSTKSTSAHAVANRLRSRATSASTKRLRARAPTKRMTRTSDVRPRAFYKRCNEQFLYELLYTFVLLKGRYFIG